MNILVYDVAAESGGALTVLKRFIEYAKNDITNNYYILVSMNISCNSSNINFFYYPWIKKSWLHRILFDIAVPNNIINNNKIDKIISLQNSALPFTKVSQIIYFHNILPFASKKYKPYENMRYWIYQHIIKKLYIKGFKKAESIVVQAQWIKDLLQNEFSINTKIIVRKVDKIELKEGWKNTNTYIYPSGPQDFKNHWLIVNALELCKNRDVHCAFTITGYENRYTKKLYKYIHENDINIEFLGTIPSQKLIELMRYKILIYPSTIETVGLPLIEMKSINGLIYCIDLHYAREALQNYQNVQYFSNYYELATLIESGSKVRETSKENMILNNISTQGNLYDKKIL